MSTPQFAFGALGITISHNAFNSLQTISEDKIKDNDVALVLWDDKIYIYRMNSTSSETPDNLYIVQPYNETGDKRWILSSQELFNTNIIQLLGNYIETGKIKSIDGENFIIEASDGSQVIIEEDGKVIFPSTVSGADPVGNQDFITKGWFSNYLESDATIIFRKTVLKCDWFQGLSTRSGQYFTTINHHKNTTDLIVQVWDEDFAAVIPERIEIFDENSIVIWMNEIINATVLVL